MKAEEKIGFKEPIAGELDKIVLKHDEILRIRKTNLATFKKLVIRQHYDEIYVNIGKAMLELVQGFDTLARAYFLFLNRLQDRDDMFEGAHAQRQRRGSPTFLGYVYCSKT